MTASIAMSAAPVKQRRHRRTGLLRRPIAVAALAVIGLFVVGGLLAPLLVGDPYQQDLKNALAGPSVAHLLGTDDLGRDVLARLVYGARVSLLVGVLTTVCSMLVATPLSILAGYYRGAFDTVLGRLMDVMLAFPSVIMAVGFAAILGPSLMTVTLALGIGHVPWLIRVIRGETLSLRERDYVRAARLDGARTPAVVLRYLLPNLSGILIVQATLMIPGAIIGEAVLSFLGIGIRPPEPSWGVMLVTAQDYLTSNPLLAAVPGIAIALISLSFNMFGDQLRDALDPRTAK